MRFFHETDQDENSEREVGVGWDDPRNWANANREPARSTVSVIRASEQ